MSRRSITLSTALIAITAHAAPMTSQRLAQANTESTQWLMGARTHDEQRFIPLTQINESNVNTLGLAWYADLDSNRGQEATPLMISHWEQIHF